MIPILYENTETEFRSNGLGRLRDCISCRVTEERNGIYECEFEYPVTGHNSNKIRHGRIIAVTHDSSGDIQPFDIIASTKPIAGIVTWRAVHISYRLTKIVTHGTGINSLADAFARLKAKCFPSNNHFEYATDKTSTGRCGAFDGIPKSVKSVLGGVEGSILDAYGGEYEWDRFSVRLYSARGTDRSMTIRYGVNLIDYTDETDYTDAYTESLPFWANGENTVVALISVRPTGIPIIGYNARRECVPLDLSGEFETQPSQNELYAAARSYMERNEVNLPKQTISVDFVRLQDSEEYAQYAKLMDCRLCDTVRVVFPLYNMSGRLKIVKVVYDVLLERYESMELGSLSTTLSEALGIKK